MLAFSLLARTPVRPLLRLAAPPRAALGPLVRLLPALVLWYVFLALALGSLLPAPPWLERLYEGLSPRNTGETVALIATVVVLAPAVEELFLRGLCLSVLADGFGPRAAAGVTAVLFGLLHVAPGKVLAIAPFGYVLARVAWSTRSLLPGFAAHAAANALGVAAGFAPGTAATGAAGRESAVAVGLIAVALTLPVFRFLREVEAAGRAGNGSAARLAGERPHGGLPGDS